MAVLKSILIASSAVFLASCSHVSYVIQAGVGQWSLYNHERPVEEVIADPQTPARLREQLSAIPEIREFVEKEMKMKSTSNYRTYVDLKRPYVSWALTAAEPYELKIKEWSFPIVGSFPYLGFFSEASAKKWEKEQIEKGYDTHVRGVAAYSTIGYLKDPLLSSMMNGRKNDLANLLFHETTHTYIYVKGEGPFNEQIASLIGDQGEKLWIAHKFGAESEQMKEWISDHADRRIFGKAMVQCGDEAKALYASMKDDPVEVKREKKAKLFEKFRARLTDSKQTPFQSKGWQGWIEKKFVPSFDNNAALLAVLTYEDRQELWGNLYKKCGESISSTLIFIRKFTESVEKGHAESLHELLRKHLDVKGCAA